MTKAQIQSEIQQVLERLPEKDLERVLNFVNGLLHPHEPKTPFARQLHDFFSQPEDKTE